MPLAVKLLTLISRGNSRKLPGYTRAVRAAESLGLGSAVQFAGVELSAGAVEGSRLGRLLLLKLWWRGLRGLLWALLLLARLVARALVAALAGLGARAAGVAGLLLRLALLVVVMRLSVVRRLGLAALAAPATAASAAATAAAATAGLALARLCVIRGALLGVHLIVRRVVV